MEGIVVDTSSILFALSANLDIFKVIDDSGSKPVLPGVVVAELVSLSKGKGAKNRQAVLALQLIERHGIRAEEGSGYADRWIIDNARRFSAVCTNDTRLRRTLRKEGITVFAFTIDGKLR